MQPAGHPAPSGWSIVLEVATVVAVVVAVVSGHYVLAVGLVVLLAVFAIVTERAVKQAHERERIRDPQGSAVVESTSGSAE
jgi:hypothetical protein